MPDFDHVTVADLEDIVARDGSDTARGRWEAREVWRGLGAQDTGALHLRIRPGQRSPFTHRHGSVEELYLVLAGAGRAKLDDELRTLSAGDALRVGPRTARAFEAGPDGLELLAFGPRVDGDAELVDDPWTAGD